MSGRERETDALTYTLSICTGCGANVLAQTREVRCTQELDTDIESIPDGDGDAIFFNVS